jgi:hypothetical protein
MRSAFGPLRPAPDAAAVELDHEPPFKATEVCDIPPDSILASEFCAKLAAAQSHPELQLGPGLIAPQLPRAIE